MCGVGEMIVPWSDSEQKEIPTAQYTKGLTNLSVCGNSPFESNLICSCPLTPLNPVPTNLPCSSALLVFHTLSRSDVALSGVLGGLLVMLLQALATEVLVVHLVGLLLQVLHMCPARTPAKTQGQNSIQYKPNR